MMFVGFLGCYGAIQESQCLLGTVRNKALEVTWHPVLDGTWLCFPCWGLFQQTRLGGCASTEVELGDLCKEQGGAVRLRASLPTLWSSG